ncbi:DUF4956 domain-containing protein [Candidatus Endoriftia persephonae]|jgi:uncharacterized membrane protein YhiD involved in acid resistance|uniref:DUF4956 domain-containing protein n=4 Tax=Gammaproteobacteria TaxID=1236 RepID=G2FI12_9GAMM|nr:DUF4956 domain-containing protein [Candidatus Endoriftia persephone]EGV51167.1 hypothetical protein Rifp1Sym_bt00170 [endosymbiont of Riftia pachyptila (vent Ph05)]EGW53521.1 hypothetical protein TevJSym_az00020 [endosymbiont of Tevnia jerichonana (vent Tica)]KRT56268.1 hypothetical protein Ga0074115_1372 [endosymbiont of Ridgeia piscesae]KRT57196.1 putative membrane protein YhiD, involved in acid resistance [endosymbiont of Ridgeia piscesae]USF86868.1 DUF4956 domain-containing protein [Can
MLDFITVQTFSENATVVTLIYVVLLSFVLSTLVAVTYEKTYRGLSYSRNYAQTLILISIVAATVMQAVGDSLARGLGIMAAMAIIRFRTNFKDPRDIVFIFASLSVGVANGVYGFSIAIVGTLGFCLVAFLLYWSPFGQTSLFDGMVRFSLENHSESKRRLEDVLAHFCKRFTLITLRDMSQGSRLDYAYQVKLRRGKDRDDFVHELKAIDSIMGVSFYMQEATVEL